MHEKLSKVTKCMESAHKLPNAWQGTKSNQMYGKYPGIIKFMKSDLKLQHS